MSANLIAALAVLLQEGWEFTIERNALDGTVLIEAFSESLDTSVSYCRDTLEECLAALVADGGP